MKAIYTKPEMNLVEVEIEDIITTSLDVDGGDEQLAPEGSNEVQL